MRSLNRLRVRRADYQTPNGPLASVVKYYEVTGKHAMDKMNRNLIKKEYDALRQLSGPPGPHPGIVACIEVGCGPIVSPTGRIDVYYIAFEYLPGGTLLDLCKRANFGESMASFIFEELVHIVSFVHSCGLTHLDLKLENVMIGAGGRLKLIDFGFATPHHGKYNDGKLTEYAGTQYYTAPEINKERPFVGHEADVFSLGVILFALTAKRFPFSKAHAEDGLYHFIAEGRYQEYWNQLNASGVLLSDSLKHLLSGMFSYNPETRLSIEEVLNHPWVHNLPKPPEAAVRTFLQ